MYVPMRRTPYLSMDMAAITRAYQAFREALPDFAVHYAMKCNPDRRILRHLHDLGCSYEIASSVELDELRAVGVDASTVLFSNPVKMSGHIRDAAAAGVYRFAFDSVAELDKLAVHAPGAAVYVRLSTSASDSEVPSEGKFGVDALHARRLMRRAVDLGLVPWGITFHVGSQMTDPAGYDTAIARSAGLMADLRSDGIRLEMLDLGGGFPSAYVGFVPRLATVAKHIRAALDRCLPYPVELVVEPGRAIVAEAGVMVATVIGVAERSGAWWAHLDVGAFNGLMEALETGNRLRFPVTDSRQGSRLIQYNITGPSCDSQDTVLYGVPLSADLAVGDAVFIHSAGAYTTSYASRFNGFDIPDTHLALADGR
jgi:ornithine decarboxylase